MRIPHSPEFSFRDLLVAQKTPGLFERFYGKDAVLFYLGRGAVWQGIRSLRLGKGDKVLVPSYHCSMEIEPIIRAGAGVVYYRVLDDMTIDMEDLERKADEKVRAVFVIHYFGFPQAVEDIKRLCALRGLYLFEDCAHALLSSLDGKPLGTWGDVAIFSQRKTLPLTDGGALMINNGDLACPEAPARPDQGVTARRALSMALGPVKNSAVLVPLKWLKNGLSENKASSGPAGYSTGMDFDVSMGRVGMSEVSKRIMNGTDTETVVRKRRTNYAFILENLKTRRGVVFDTLATGVNPLFFPVTVEDGDRERVQERLREAGVETFIFGKFLHATLPEGDYPEACRLSRKTLCLPVHQALTERKLTAIVRAINDVL